MEFAVVYNRTSKTTDKETLKKEGESCLYYINRKELILKTSYQDVDCKASDYFRPGFYAMFQAAARHEFTYLVVPKVYELTRNVNDLIFIVQWLNKQNITVYFCDMDLEAGPLTFEQAFDGMIENIKNELINDELDDEVVADSDDMEKYFESFEVLDKKLVN